MKLALSNIKRCKLRVSYEKNSKRIPAARDHRKKKRFSNVINSTVSTSCAAGDSPRRGRAGKRGALVPTRACARQGSGETDLHPLSRAATPTPWARPRRRSDPGLRTRPRAPPAVSLPQRLLARRLPAQQWRSPGAAESELRCACAHALARCQLRVSAFGFCFCASRQAVVLFNKEFRLSAIWKPRSVFASRTNSASSFNVFRIVCLWKYSLPTS